MKLQRISSSSFYDIIKKVAEVDDYDIDSKNCGLISSEFQLIDKEYDALKLCNGTKARFLHCLKVLNIEKDTILVKEDVYYNITRNLDGDVLCDSNNFECHKAPSEYFPTIADELKVAPIYSSYSINAGDDDILLNSYFSVPRFLYLNDIFTVHLSDANHLNKSAVYHDVPEVHFKVVSLNKKKSSDNENINGFYIFKEHSELYCVSPISSLLPPKASTILATPGSIQVPLMPPCLANYVAQLRKLLLPFTKSTKPDCVPFFLLSGTNGSGKLESLKYTVESTGYHLLIVSCYEFYGIGVSAIEAKFDYIVDKTTKVGACVVAFTEFELIGKDKSGNEDARLVNSFLQRMSLIFSNRATYSTIIFGITDAKSEDITPNISRATLHTIKFQALDPETSFQTVAWLASEMGFSIKENCSGFLVKQLSGFVYADMILLVNHAIRILLEEIADKKELCLTHFKRAFEIMDAAYSDAIGAAKVPSVRWDDVGGLVELKKEIVLTLNLPLQRADILGGSLRRSGILFYGPPGTGKTLMAKAVATECSMNFLSVKGPELMNMYVGQSERNVREVFERGRAAAPCILFFDELDSLAPNRGKSGDSGGVTDRVVSQLLAEMDGLQSNRGLFVIAATNRPDLVDPALLRPGRFDKMFYLGPCGDPDSKASVLHAVINKFELASDVNVDAVVSLLPKLVTGADIYSVCSNAWLSAARRSITKKEQGQSIKLPLEVTLNDFKEGVQAMVPSLTPEDLRYYDQLAASARNDGYVLDKYFLNPTDVEVELSPEVILLIPT